MFYTINLDERVRRDHPLRAIRGVVRGKRIKELEQNIASLKQLLADAKLDNAILQEAAHPTQHFVTGLLDLSVEIV